MKCYCGIDHEKQLRKSRLPMVKILRKMLETLGYRVTLKYVGRKPALRGKGEIKWVDS